MAIVQNLTRNMSDVLDELVALLQADQDLGLKQVWGDDPKRVPVWPSAAVVEGPTTYGDPTPNYYVAIDFELYVLVFYTRITENEDLAREARFYAEAVRDSIHQNKQLNGLVVHGHVRSIDPGIARRGGAKFRAQRLTVRYISRAII